MGPTSAGNGIGSAPAQPESQPREDDGGPRSSGVDAGAGRGPRVPSPPKSFDFFDFSADTDADVDAEAQPPTPDATRAPSPAQSPGEAPHREEGSRRFPGLRPPRRPGPVSPPPPAASARFPDAPPASGEGRRTTVPEESATETTRRLRPIPAEETPARPPVPAPPSETPVVERPFVSFGQPETFDDTVRVRPHGGRTRPRALAAAACVVLGLGLIGGAVTGSWLTGESSAGSDARTEFVASGELWHSVPVDQLFPPTVQGEGAGPGGADRTWTRVAVAPDTDCANAFDPLLREALAPVGCLRLLRATYTDATRSLVTTVGLLFTKADATAMTSLKTRFQKDGLDRRTDLMPRPYAVEGTVAAGFGDDQRASWTVSVLTDAPVVVYAVSGFADGRAVTDPQAAEDAMEPGATTAPAQAGLGHEAQGLADRVERGFRKTVTSATEKPS
ncbi:hypothetical protein ACIPC1_26440 [Streptomyces sp. NPDC087263]|uniref:hypothetical protein n=1 Tax=Streptomyces sp. NPDC087263 TaxID=3365773 RepID=UPI0037F89E7E